MVFKAVKTVGIWFPIHLCHALALFRGFEAKCVYAKHQMRIRDSQDSQYPFVVYHMHKSNGCIVYARLHHFLIKFKEVNIFTI
jgi:hypothetical protein